MILKNPNDSKDFGIAGQVRRVEVNLELEFKLTNPTLSDERHKTDKLLQRHSNLIHCCSDGECILNRDDLSHPSITVIVLSRDRLGRVGFIRQSWSNPYAYKHLEELACAEVSNSGTVGATIYSRPYI